MKLSWGAFWCFPRVASPGCNICLLMVYMTWRSGGWKRGRCLALEELRLSYCSDMRMVPEGLRGLTQLKVFGLYNMPVIERRIEKDTGDDYYKIQHVPSIQIQ
ncbi:disease resistance [Musa troglodytarum]|uniref:Disease resistance n=1 Tax=Musa troglodytarum TaxID=320322 RepID=A0A9E7H1Q0_9LILI|nr:disease resistance [Musa troglodytarum]